MPSSLTRVVPLAYSGGKNSDPTSIHTNTHLRMNETYEINIYFPSSSHLPVSAQMLTVMLEARPAAECCAAVSAPDWEENKLPL